MDDSEAKTFYNHVKNNKDTKSRITGFRRFRRPTLPAHGPPPPVDDPFILNLEALYYHERRNRGRGLQGLVIPVRERYSSVFCSARSPFAFFSASKFTGNPSSPVLPPHSISGDRSISPPIIPSHSASSANSIGTMSRQQESDRSQPVDVLSPSY
jgi:hypothetical protein